MKWWFKRPLYVQIAVGIAVGIGLGLLLGPEAAALKPVGDIFLRLLSMLVVPLTFFTLVAGMAKLENLRSLRSIGGWVVLYYAVSSVIAAAVGVAVALLVRPGREAAGLLDAGIRVEASRLNLWDQIVSWFPSNPVEAMSQGNLFQVIVFALIVGAALLALGERVRTLKTLADEAAGLMIKVTDLVMKISPYGILALVANMVGSFNAKMLKDVARFVGADVAAQVLLLALLYPAVIKILGRLTVGRFYRHATPALLVAASTTSSGATLPIAMTVADRQMGIQEKIWGFSLPLGATMNQNGMAVAVGVIAVFAANLYGVALTPSLLVQFVLLGLILSAGTAGVKGGGIVISGILLQTLNMPLTLIPLLASLWPILDIGHTINNVAGDLVGTAAVANRLGLLDRKVFRDGRPPIESSG
jgi:Na+/H+-dicarboxylate symporter